MGNKGTKDADKTNLGQEETRITNLSLHTGTITLLLLLLVIVLLVVCLTRMCRGHKDEFPKRRKSKHQRQSQNFEIQPIPPIPPYQHHQYHQPPMEMPIVRYPHQILDSNFRDAHRFTEITPPPLRRVQGLQSLYPQEVHTRIPIQSPRIWKDCLKTPQAIQTGSDLHTTQEFVNEKLKSVAAEHEQTQL